VAVGLAVDSGIAVAVGLAVSSAKTEKVNNRISKKYFILSPSKVF